MYFKIYSERKNDLKKVAKIINLNNKIQNVIKEKKE